VSSSPADAVAHAFREEFGRTVAALGRALGDLDRAEEALQDAYVVALDRWPKDGVPDNPGAWIFTAAKRRAIDRLRREAVLRSKQSELARELEESVTGLPDEEDAIPDERLALMFACCHPALAHEAQVQLTLRLVGGLTVPEVARGLLVPEATVAQRLVRAKRKLRASRIPIRVPDADALPDRLAAVLAVLYLVFNEGHMATAGRDLTRDDLAAEAIRLARLVFLLMPGEAEPAGLLALLLLVHSRRPARVDRQGHIVLLADQDRSRWDAALIAEALPLVERALRTARPPGPYALQAAIAALHAEAARAEDTDWWQIAALYRELARVQPGPVVELNRAVAIAMARGPEAGLALVDRVAPELEEYHLLHAARADLLRRLDRTSEAAAAYRRALELASNEAEREFLQGRLAQLGR
jgi:RNA polymerase sigma-70 factor (ECF subfamily)